MKAQDVMVALKLLSADAPQGYARLGQSVGLSASEAHACVRRLFESRLVEPDSQRVNRQALLRFLVNGLPYVFPASLQASTRGMPTAWAAPLLINRLVANEPPPVWPDPEGTVRGQAVKPLYPSAVAAAGRDPQFYDLLALVDVLRLGRARERKWPRRNWRSG